MIIETKLLYIFCNILYVAAQLFGGEWQTQ